MCWGPLLARPGTIYYCLGANLALPKYNLGTCSSCGPRCHDLRSFLERHHASEEQSTSIFEYQLLFHLYLHCKPIWSDVIRFISTGHLTFGRSAQKLLCSEFLCSPLRGPQQLDMVLHLSDLKSISCKHKLTQIMLFFSPEPNLLMWLEDVRAAATSVSLWSRSEFPSEKGWVRCAFGNDYMRGCSLFNFTLSVRTKGIHDG